MEPLISIIVPVYNVDKYLNKCIQSIIEQTYSNLEIIIIDDGSTDNSPALCDEWAKRDSRIQVIHKANGGQSDARNVGLSIARGEYIGFVDSDDWIHREMYEYMISILSSNEADIAECGMFKYSNMDDDIPFQQAENIAVFEREQAVKTLLDESYFTCTVPSKLLKREIATTVLFETGKINEDILWPYYAFVKASRVVHTSRQLYAYYQRPGSTMNSGFTEKRLDGMYANKKRAEEVKRDFPSLYPLAERTYIGGCFYQYRALCRDKTNNDSAKLKKTLYQLYKSGDRKVAFKGMKFKHKIYHSAFSIAPNFTSFVMNLMKIGL